MPVSPIGEQYRLLLENLPDGFASHQIVADSDGNTVDYIFIDVNPAFEKMTGFSADHVIGKKITEVLPEIEDDCSFDWIGTYGKVALTGESICFEQYSKVLKRWYQVTAYSDKYGYFATVIRDITDNDRHETEEELTHAHLRLLTVMDSIDALVFVSDLDTYEVIYINEYGLKINSNKNILGKKCWEVFHKQSAPCESCHYDKLLGTDGSPGGIYTWEYQNAHDGRWFYCICRAIEWIDGRIVHLKIATENTERKRFEAELISSLEENEVLLRETHHRVKNNLAVIIALMDMQRRLINSDQVAATLKDMSSRIYTMALVHEMLYRSKSLSRINMQIYLQTLITHIQSLLQPKSRFDFIINAQDLEMDLDAAIPSGLIVHELVSNALRHAFPEDGDISSSNKAEIGVLLERKGNLYKLLVYDNGVGLPPDVELATVRSMGLRIVRMLGEHQLGGRLEVNRNRTGGGTEFILCFEGDKNGWKNYSHSRR